MKEIIVERRRVAKKLSTTSVLWTFFAIITVIQVVKALPKAQFNNVESYRVEATPALPVHNDEETTTVLLINNENRSTGPSNKYLNIKPEIGLLTSTARTFIQDGIITEYGTKILGTTLDNGRLYAQLLQKTSRILYTENNKLNTATPAPSGNHEEINFKYREYEKYLEKNRNRKYPSVNQQNLHQHNDLIGDINWQTIDDTLTRKSDIELIKAEANSSAMIDDQFLRVSQSSSTSSSSSSGNVEKVEPKKIIVPNKITPNDNLETFTIKNLFSPSGYSDDDTGIEQNVQYQQVEKSRSAKVLQPEQLNEDEHKMLRMSSLSTVTYYGFAEFTTIVGDTVIIFTPSTSSNNLNLNQITSIKVEATLSTSAGNNYATKLPIEVTKANIEPTFTIQQTADESTVKYILPTRQNHNGDTEISSKKIHIDASIADSFILANKISNQPTTTLSSASKEPAKMLSRPSDEDIKKIFESLSMAELAKKKSEETFITLTTAATKMSATDTTIIAPSEPELKVTGGATTIFFEDDPFEKFEQQQQQQITTENFLTKNDVTTQEADEVDENSTTTPAAITSEANLNEFHEDQNECATKVSDILFVAEPKTLTYLTTYFIPDDIAATTSISIESNIITTTVKSESTVWKCKQDDEINEATNLLTNKASSTVTSISTTEKISVLEKPEESSNDEVSNSESTTITTLMTTTEKDDDEELEQVITTTNTPSPIVLETSEKYHVTESTNDNSILTTTPFRNDIEDDETETSDDDEEDGEDEEEIELIYKTLYTTYTYLTTFFHDSTTSISSRKEVVQNVITSTIYPSSVGTDYPASDKVSQLSENLGAGRPKENILIDNESNDGAKELDITNISPTKTMYTTYTYYTTIFVDGETEIMSRTEIYTNIIDSTVSSNGENNQFHSDVGNNEDIINPAESLKVQQIEQTAQPDADDELVQNVIKSINYSTLKRSESMENLEKATTQKIDVKTSSSSTSSISSSKNSKVLLPDGYENDDLSLTNTTTNNNKRNLLILDDQISSESSNTDEILPSPPTLLLQTSFTTFTYYTTMYNNHLTNVISRLETITNIVTETLQPTLKLENFAAQHQTSDINNDDTTLPITYFTTFTYWTTLAKDGEITTISREETISNIITPSVMSTIITIPTTVIDDQQTVAVITAEILPTTTKAVSAVSATLSTVNENSSDDSLNTIEKLLVTTKIISPIDTTDSINPTTTIIEPTTFYTTYTYYTTSYSNDDTIINSRFETITNIVESPINGRSFDLKQNSNGLEDTIKFNKIDPVFVQMTSVHSTITPTLNDEPNLLSLDMKKIIDADGISTLFYITKLLLTEIDGTKTEVINSESSINIDEVKKTQQLSNEIQNSLISPSATRSYKTGLVRLIDGTMIINKTTTLYQSKVIGTIIDGRYAQIIESTSSYLIEKTLSPAIITPTGTQTENLITATSAPVSPRFDAIQTSVSDRDNKSEKQNENDEETDEEETDDSREKSSLSSQRKKTFSPVIRPFASRNRPQFAPKRKNLAPSSATIITRSDFTPTITATLTTTPNRLDSSIRGRFGGNRRLNSSGQINLSSTVGSGGSTSNVPRRFSRLKTNNLSIQPTSVGNRNRLSSRPVSSSSIKIQPSRRGGVIVRGNSISSGGRQFSSPYLGSQRGRLKPTLALDNQIQNSQSVYSVQTTGSQESEEENITPSLNETNDDENPDVETTTENLRRNQNPLLKFRRPPLARQNAFAPTPRSGSQQAVTIRRNPLIQRAKSTQSPTTTTTTTQKPRPRTFQRPPVIQSSLQNRPRPQSNLFPPRGLFQQQQQQQIIQDLDEEKHKSDDTDDDDEGNLNSEYEDDDTENGESENRKRRDSKKRIKRETSGEYGTRSTFRSRFRRPTTPRTNTIIAAEEPINVEELDIPPSQSTSVFPPNRGRSGGAASRFSSRNQKTSPAAATTQQQQQKHQNNRLRPTKPTTSQRTQFTLRGGSDNIKEVTKSLNTNTRNFRRPTTATANRRSSTTNREIDFTLTSTGKNEMASENVGNNGRFFDTVDTNDDTESGQLNDDNEISENDIKLLKFLNKNGDHVLQPTEVGDEARYNLATRIMSNGVEVIVAASNNFGDSNKLKSNQKQSILRILPSHKPLTLAPSTLKDQMIMVMPSESENFTVPIINPNHFVTKTCLTTFTYRTTYLYNGKTTIESREKIISNIATEERNYLQKIIKPTTIISSSGVTLTKTPELAIGIFHTTYTYLNTISQDNKESIILSSRHTVTNTITGPDDYIGFLQPSNYATPVFETNTYYSKIKSSDDANEENILTQIIITESLPSKSVQTIADDFDDKSEVIKLDAVESKIKYDLLTTDIIKTQFVTYTYYNTIIDNDGVIKVHTNISVSPDILTEKLYLYTKPSRIQKSDTHTTNIATATSSLMLDDLDFEIYATKTHQTTFTYFSTFLESLSTMIDTQTTVLEEVQTETIPLNLIDNELRNELKLQFKFDEHLQTIKTTATLLNDDHETLEIIAMNRLKPSEITSRIMLMNSDIVNDTKNDFDESNLIDDNDAASSEVDTVYVNATKENDYPMSNLINSFNLNSLTVLKPVLNAVAGLIQNNFVTTATVPTSPAKYNLISNSNSSNNSSSNLSSNNASYNLNSDGRIYIPIQNNDNSIKPISSQINSQIKINLPPLHKKSNIDGIKFNNNGKPLLNGGIPISPGEIITATSDVIVGKPGIIGQMPRIPPFNQQQLPKQQQLQSQHQQQHQQLHQQQNQHQHMQHKPPLTQNHQHKNPYQSHNYQYQMTKQQQNLMIPISQYQNHHQSQPIFNHHHQQQKQKQQQLNTVLIPPVLKKSTTSPNFQSQNYYSKNFDTMSVLQSQHIPPQQQHHLVHSPQNIRQHMPLHPLQSPMQSHKQHFDHLQTDNNQLQQNHLIDQLPADSIKNYQIKANPNSNTNNNNEIIEIKRIPEIYSTDLPFINKYQQQQQVLFNIQPSQIAQILIPHNDSNKLSVQILNPNNANNIELHKNGQYFNEPLPYQTGAKIITNFPHNVSQTIGNKLIYKNHHQININSNLLSQNIDINVPPIKFKKQTNFPISSSQPIRGQIIDNNKFPSSMGNIPHVKIPLTDHNIQVNLTPQHVPLPTSYLESSMLFVNNNKNNNHYQAINNKNKNIESNYNQYKISDDENTTKKLVNSLQKTNFGQLLSSPIIDENRLELNRQNQFGNFFYHQWPPLNYHSHPHQIIPINSNIQNKPFEGMHLKPNVNFQLPLPSQKDFKSVPQNYVNKKDVALGMTSSVKQLLTNRFPTTTAKLVKNYQQKNFSHLDDYYDHENEEGEVVQESNSLPFLPNIKDDEYFGKRIITTKSRLTTPILRQTTALLAKTTTVLTTTAKPTTAITKLLNNDHTSFKLKTNLLIESPEYLNEKLNTNYITTGSIETSQPVYNISQNGRPFKIKPTISSETTTTSKINRFNLLISNGEKFKKKYTTTMQSPLPLPPNDLLAHTQINLPMHENEYLLKNNQTTTMTPTTLKTFKMTSSITSTTPSISTTKKSKIATTIKNNFILSPPPLPQGSKGEIFDYRESINPHNYGIIDITTQHSLLPYQHHQQHKLLKHKSTTSHENNQFIYKPLLSSSTLHSITTPAAKKSHNINELSTNMQPPPLKKKIEHVMGMNPPPMPPSSSIKPLLMYLPKISATTTNRPISTASPSTTKKSVLDLNADATSRDSDSILSTINNTLNKSATTITSFYKPEIIIEKLHDVKSTTKPLYNFNQGNSSSIYLQTLNEHEAIEQPDEFSIRPTATSVVKTVPISSMSKNHPYSIRKRPITTTIIKPIIENTILSNESSSYSNDDIRIQGTENLYEIKLQQQSKMPTLLLSLNENSKPSSKLLSTYYITNTKTLTVTTTKTSVLTNFDNIQSVRTLTITKRIINTITETETKKFTSTLSQIPQLITKTATTTTTETVTPLLQSLLPTSTAAVLSSPTMSTILINKNLLNRHQDDINLDELIINYEDDYRQHHLKSTTASNHSRNNQTNYDNDSIFVIMSDSNHKNHLANNNFTSSINYNNHISEIDYSDKSDSSSSVTTTITTNNDEDNNDDNDDDEDKNSMLFELTNHYDNNDNSNELIKSPNHVLLSGILISTPSKKVESITSRNKTNECQPDCKPSRNELCQRINNKMTCICRPGFARMFPDRPCKPTYTYSLQLPFYRIGKQVIKFNNNLLNPNSIEYIQLTSLIHESLDRMIMQSDFRDIYHGVHITGYENRRTSDHHYEDGIIGHFYVQLSDNSDERRLVDVFKKYLRNNNFSIGGTELYSTRSGVNELQVFDFDECQNLQFHDCSDNAKCFNFHGTYTCSCLDGYADLSENPIYPGRICSSEIIGCEKCHYHGNCYTPNDNDEQPLCECFRWYTGQSCQYNLKIFLIALLAIGTILVLLLLFCIMITCTKRYNHLTATTTIAGTTLTTSSLTHQQQQQNLLHSNLSGINLLKSAKQQSTSTCGKKLKFLGKSNRHDKVDMIMKKDTCSTSSEISQNSLDTLSYITKNLIIKHKNNNSSKKKSSNDSGKKLEYNNQRQKYQQQQRHQIPRILQQQQQQQQDVDNRYSQQQQQEQNDRSLTVIIPRVKYHPITSTTSSASFQQQEQLQQQQIIQQQPSHRSSSESKIVAYLDANAQISQQNDNLLIKKISTSSKHGALNTTSTGALVSAGFEVSATVIGNQQQQLQQETILNGQESLGILHQDLLNAIETSSALAIKVTNASKHKNNSNNLDYNQQPQQPQQYNHHHYQQRQQQNHSHDNDKIGGRHHPNAQFSAYKKDSENQECFIDSMDNWLDTIQQNDLYLNHSEARSFDETTIHPQTKSLRSVYEKQLTQLNNDEANTMAERDIGSTFLLPHTHLYKPDRGSDASGFDSF